MEQEQSLNKPYEKNVQSGDPTELNQLNENNGLEKNLSLLFVII